MKIVVDTNIIFSAMLNSNSNISKLLLQNAGPFEYYSCSFLKDEIRQHQPKLLKITRLSPAELMAVETLVTANIHFISDNLIPKSQLSNALNLLADIDENDTPFVALANTLKAKLWTGDRKLYDGLRKKAYRRVLTTAEMQILFERSLKK